MKKKLILVSLIFLAIAITAVAAVEFGVIQPKAPEIVGLYLSWKEVTYSTTKINAVVVLYNPNKIDVRVTLKDVEIHINGIKFAWAEGNIEVNLLPEKNTEAYALLVIDNSKLQSVWVSHILLNEKSVATVKMKLTVFDLPLEVQRPIETNILGDVSGKVTGEGK